MFCTHQRVVSNFSLDTISTPPNITICHLSHQYTFYFSVSSSFLSWVKQTRHWNDDCSSCYFSHPNPACPFLVLWNSTSYSGNCVCEWDCSSLYLRFSCNSFSHPRQPTMITLHSSSIVSILWTVQNYRISQATWTHLQASNFQQPVLHRSVIYTPWQWVDVSGPFLFNFFIN